jgi:Tfp pilus assembly protein PilF
MASLFSILGEQDSELKYLSMIDNIRNKEFFNEKLGEIILKKNQDEGIKILSNIDTPDAIVSIALSYLQRQNFNEAKNTLEQYFEKNSFNYKVAMVYALLNLLIGQTNVTIKTIRQVFIQKDLDANSCFIISLAYFCNQDYKKCNYWANIGLNINPIHKDLLRLKFSVFLILQDNNIIENYLSKYLSFKSDDVIINECLAYYYFLNKQFSSAIEILKTLIITDDKNSTYWNNLAISYYKNSQNDKALSHYLQALKLSKDNDMTLYSNVLKYMLKEEEYDKLVDLYLKLDMQHNVDLTFNSYLNIHSCFLRALIYLRRFDEYQGLINEIKINSFNDTNLKIYVINEIISFFSRYCYNPIELLKCGKELESILSSKEDIDNRVGNLNNIIYSYLEADTPYEDYTSFQYFRSNLDKSPIYNATYGLYCIKAGNLEKGLSYYEKSIIYSSDNVLTIALKQKRDLETAKYYLKKNEPKRVFYYLKKVKKNSTKETYYYSEQAQTIEYFLNRRNQ